MIPPRAIAADPYRSRTQPTWEIADRVDPVVWSRQVPGPLSADEVEHFAARGYIVRPQLFNPGEVFMLELEVVDRTHTHQLGDGQAKLALHLLRVDRDPSDQLTDAAKDRLCNIVGGGSTCFSIAEARQQRSGAPDRSIGVGARGIQTDDRDAEVLARASVRSCRRSVCEALGRDSGANFSIIINNLCGNALALRGLDAIAHMLWNAFHVAHDAHQFEQF